MRVRVDAETMHDMSPRARQRRAAVKTANATRHAAIAAKRKCCVCARASAVSREANMPAGVVVRSA